MMPAMKRNLSGMIVIITGASAGIGHALAVELSNRGAKLVLSARRTERLQSLNQTLGGQHLVVPADVADPQQCKKLIDTAAAHFGRIDTLVCNAGYGICRPMVETSTDDERRLFQTNVFGTTDCIRAAVPILRQQELRDGFRGQLVIVSSAAARRGLPYYGIYSATKAAQLSLAEALRIELKPDKIAVTSVHPVGTETEFFDVAQKDHQKMPGGTPVGLRQSAQTVARSIAAAIARPRPEVWPMRPARWLLSLATLSPRLVDCAMTRERRQLDRANR
jgi:short-subunit dehydrogenase